ncbi:hypothetical protein AJ79_03501 [Helicocarpus griseus UAMH5409]|uniref:CENP-V/GFA domain-containing protein n=1 Tax=Helicocarpus griseus UAMH5409 TaxID=1447875 RepID=A0A2B7XXZ6_9EURO|nr:hypothetical protein AJ79_03501 [Helicocarpus griseus UAMH5409]
MTLCHCANCRWTTGMLCASYLLLESAPNLDGLVEYVEFTTASRWFCGTCGAHVFLQIREDHENEGRFMVARGTIADAELQTESIEHLCLESTTDGSLFGSSASVSNAPQSGTSNACFTGVTLTATSRRPGDSVSKDSPQQTNPPTRNLPASCHCTGVQIIITPPDHTSRLPSSPWSDTLVPFHSSPNASANPADVKWWLRDNDKKYLSNLCGCDSCRLASGFPIQSWVFVPRSNIFKASDSSSLAYNDLGTLKRYNSSPGVYREFCSACGATVFWHCEERPGVVDVSVGLLRAESGVRAEDWLDWELGRVSFEEMAVDRGMIRCLKKCLNHGVGYN